MNTLRFPGETLAQLRALLLCDAPNEGAAIVLAERLDLPGGRVLLAQDIVQVPPEFAKAAPFRIDIAPEFIALMLKRARLEQRSLVFVHTHPFASAALFSAQDDHGESILLPTLFQRAPHGPHGAVVLTSVDALGRCYSAPDQPPEHMRLVEVGRCLRTWPSSLVDEVAPEFDRTVRALGIHAQEQLTRLRIGIVGLGGIGSLVAQQLAHLGVRRFLLLDPDIIEPTNLNRVVGSSPSSVQREKVAVARDLLSSIQPTADIDAVAGDIRYLADARRLLDVDLIFCCTDSHGSRAVLNQLAFQYFVPVIDIGVRIDAPNGQITDVVGRIQTLAPGIPCLVCENLLDPEQVRRDMLSDEERRRDPYIVGALEPQPAVISINGVAASLAITMFLAITCGFPLQARHQIYFADRGVVRVVSATQAPTCYVCAKSGAFGQGDRWSFPGRQR